MLTSLRRMSLVVVVVWLEVELTLTDSIRSTASASAVQLCNAIGELRNNAQYLQKQKGVAAEDCCTISFFI